MKAKKKPAYFLHKPTGQARVRIDGKDYYLGEHGTTDSYARYDELITKWLRKQEFSSCLLTVDNLVLMYLDFAVGYNRKNGKPTAEVIAVRVALRPLVKLFGILRVREFGPLKLKAVRDEIVKSGSARKTVNDRVHRIRRMFRWGVENELVPAEVLLALEAVTALKRGKTTARDCPPVQPVDDVTVEATLPHLSPVVADMIRLQRLTGMRPAEVCLLRNCDIDRTGETWKYIPAEHKTEHHGKDRVIFIGPLGQAILMKYLVRGEEEYCFSPAESEAKRRQARHEARVTPMSCGNVPGAKPKVNPQKKASDKYTSCSYRRAVERACDKAFPVPQEIKQDAKAVGVWRKSHRWAPNRLRHAAATEIRKRFGLEAAQVALGHSEANTTQIYAERDMQKAAAIMKEIG